MRIFSDKMSSIPLPVQQFLIMNPHKTFMKTNRLNITGAIGCLLGGIGRLGAIGHILGVVEAVGVVGGNRRYWEYWALLGVS